MQSKKGSFTEALVSTLVGYVVSLVCAPVIFWVCGVAIKPTQLGSVTALFTVVSVLRGYLIRRYFNGRIVKKNPPKS
ncbi:DUF7220 family protein [Larkinella humicola]|uniref:Uncharacterized protein n=1 Tax=Larkinella humicola TaxID=2607654 RepID=A0A5N1JN63_9BACT|nr:hypothetical protein [Larkinella humicola]KAA9357268.1 hypothetical protein F0P93_05900 [Larkinella humicola]